MGWAGNRGRKRRQPSLRCRESWALDGSVGTSQVGTKRKGVVGKGTIIFTLGVCGSASLSPDWVTHVMAGNRVEIVIGPQEASESIKQLVIHPRGSPCRVLSRRVA